MHRITTHNAPRKRREKNGRGREGGTGGRREDQGGLGEEEG